MADPADLRLLSLENPFRPSIVPIHALPRATGGPGRPPDVPEIHAGARQAVIETLEAVRGDGRSRVVVVAGESGSGKSHLADHLVRPPWSPGAGPVPPEAFFAAVDPVPDAGRVGRHILSRLVAALARRCGGRRPLELLAGWLRVEAYLSLELPRRYGIERIVESLSVERLDHEPGLARSLARRLVDGLKATARAGSAGGPILEEVLLHLLGLYRGRTSASDLERLRGGDADDDEVPGAGPLLASEEAAGCALLTLGTAASAVSPILLLLDQTETLATSSPGTVRSLLAAVASLAQGPGYLVVLTVLDDVWAQSYEHLAAAAGISPSRVVSLARLREEEARALVAARLAGLYREVVPPYPTYPFHPSFFRRLACLSAREVLDSCGRSLDRMRGEGRVTEMAA